MRKSVLRIVIISEVIVILIVLFVINNKNRSNVLGTNIILNEINRDEVIFSKAGGLENFFEPMPNEVINRKVDWENVNGPQNPTYKINSDGFNQVNNFGIEKSKKTYRILALGDSLTFGQNVNTEDNYPSQLQDQLDNNCKNNDFQVLNLGVYGYDIKYSVERYRLRGQKYNPDLVLWLFIQGDFKRVDEILFPLAQKYKLEMKKGEYEAAIKNGNLYPQWNRAQNEVVSELGGEENVLRLQENFLRELNQYYDGRLTLLFFPNMEGKYKDILRKFSESRPGISFYSNLPSISFDKGELLKDGHPSSKGYGEMAKNLFDYLKSNKIIPCN